MWAAQLMYLRRHKLAARVEGDLIKMQQDIDAGLRVEFHVKPEVMGLVVGFRGQNVTKVTQVRLPLTSSRAGKLPGKQTCSLFALVSSAAPGSWTPSLHRCVRLAVTRPCLVTDP